MKRMILCLLAALLLCTATGGATAEGEMLPEIEEKIEIARQTLKAYLDVEADERFLTAYCDSLADDSCQVVTFGPAEGRLYRVAFDAQGTRVHRVYTAHTGEAEYWPDEGFTDVTGWAARWGEPWLIEGQMPDNGLEMTGEAGKRMREIERETSAYLQAHGIDTLPWTGKWETDVLLTDGGWGEITDLVIIIRYPNGSGTDLGRAGSSIDIGYSLYSKQVTYLALIRDGNG